jgi:hypothetical protein
VLESRRRILARPGGSSFMRRAMAVRHLLTPHRPRFVPYQPQGHASREKVSTSLPAGCTERVGAQPRPSGYGSPWPSRRSPSSATSFAWGRPRSKRPKSPAIGRRSPSRSRRGSSICRPHSQHRLAGAGPPLWALSQATRAGHTFEHHRPRAGRVHVGRQSARCLRLASLAPSAIEPNRERHRLSKKRQPIDRVVTGCLTPDDALDSEYATRQRPSYQRLGIDG